MSNSVYESGVKQRSGWIIPIGVFLVTAALSAVFLLLYLGPAPTSLIDEHPSPTARTDPVVLTVAETKFTIPANFLEYRRAREGGAMKDVSLFAALPDFHGYSDWQSRMFSSSAADSPIVYMLLRDERFNLGEAERLRRIYLGYVVDPRGQPGPFGLTQYEFRDDSGYRGEDLLVGRMGTREIVLRCVRLSSTVPSPSCLRDERFARHVALSYRFKRTQLSRWQEIASGVDALVDRFERGR